MSDDKKALQSCPVEGPFMPDTPEDKVRQNPKKAAELLQDAWDMIKSDIAKFEMIQDILAQLPDETTPSSRYLKELILPKLRRMREILG
jgi:hypothetical protein